MPDLCADRIDYALRDQYSLDKHKSAVKIKLAALIVKNNEYMFDDLTAAEKFAEDYLLMDSQTWANPREIAVYEIMAQALRHALDNSILRHEDLFSDDKSVMEILRAKGDAYIRKKLAYLTPHFRIEVATPGHFHVFVKTKIRYVDPKILIKGKVQRLSELSKNYKSKMDKHIKTGKKGWHLFVYPD
jgi:HD superfamily phosphohydrolase